MVKITAKNFDLTDAIKNITIEKFSKFEKFLTDDGRIEVVLESKQYGQKIEVFFISEGSVIKAHSIDEDLYVAIDLVFDKIDRQIKKHNNKRNENSNESIRFIDIKKNHELVKTKGRPKVVKRKRITSKPMFEEEAIEQMELLNHKSFIFFNESAGSLCMLYKRHDGDYGVIEPN